MTLYAIYPTKDQESLSPTSQALAMEPEQTTSTMSSQHTAALEAIYPTASPPKVTRTSTSPEPSHLNHNEAELQPDYLSTSTTGMQQQPRVDSMWTASVASQIGSDDFDNYALHSSPALHGLPLPDGGGGVTGTSPRTSAWSHGSEQHVRSVSWDHFPRQNLSSHMPSFHLRDSFVQDTNLPYTPMNSFDGSEGAGFLLGRSQTEPYNQTTTTTSTTSQYPPAPLPPSQQQVIDDSGVPTPESMRGLSPCSTSLGFKLDSDDIDDLSAVQSTKGSMSGTESHSQLNSTAPSPMSGGGAPPSSSSNNSGSQSNKAQDEPYAKLIWRAFMSVPSHAMTLQEIYQWFRENTDKGKDESKGWQNSIRHNLSMNLAFTKRERRSSTTKDETTTTSKTGSPKIHLTTTASSSSSTTESKKSTEWFLQDWAITHGVQSTTRYRKGNSSSSSSSSPSSTSLNRRSPSSRTGYSHYRSYPRSSAIDIPGSVSNGYRRTSGASRYLPLHHHHHGIMRMQQQQRSRLPSSSSSPSSHHLHNVIQQQMQHFQFSQNTPSTQRFLFPQEHHQQQSSHHHHHAYPSPYQQQVLETDRLQIGLDYHHQSQPVTDPQLTAVTEPYPSTTTGGVDLSAYSMPVTAAVGGATSAYDEVVVDRFGWAATSTEGDNNASTSTAGGFHY
ncbi:hypothetical protein QBC38DRAFT_51409 [Podospora fimiseda]|uniref:Fork-head domain-containing protein n=1 Tax=Podospora fimiseda TaxID=252190 RepID=A0AAN7BHN9_9PEZI|nr:hypothetical protein QBC38DRAFT_51409 [Podospora fimiseda]